MKLQHFILLLVVMPSSLLVKGQFREGFVITHERDTIHGKVFHRMDPSKYNVCRFFDGTGVKEYTPSELLGFGFINDAFFSTCYVEGKFAEVLIKGKISMVLIDNVIHIQKEGYNIFPVEKGEEVGEKTIKIRGTPRWKGILNYWMSDCNSTFFDLKKAGGTVKELTHILKNYHDCMDEIFVEYKSQKPWTQLEPGVYLGLGFTDVQIQQSPTQFDFMNSNYYMTTPVVGLNLTITSPRLTEMFALELNSGLNSTKIHSLVVREDHSATYYHESVFNINTFTFGTYCRYTVYNGRPAFYIHAGLQYYNNFYDFVIFTDELRMNTVNTTERSPGRDMSQTGLVLNGGLSVMYKLPFFRLGAGLFYSPSLISNDMIIAPIHTYSVRIIISR